jgi:hypothetical protein
MLMRVWSQNIEKYIVKCLMVNHMAYYLRSIQSAWKVLLTLFKRPLLTDSNWHSANLRCVFDWPYNSLSKIFVALKLYNFLSLYVTELNHVTFISVNIKNKYYSTKNYKGYRMHLRLSKCQLLSVSNGHLQSVNRTFHAPCTHERRSVDAKPVLMLF